MAHRAPLVLAGYSDRWPAEFEAERALISAALNHPAARIEHVGSTAVPGLSAKPIIDMMLGASSLRELESWIPLLERLDYQYVPVHEAEIPDRRFLAKPHTRPRRFHVHGVVLGETFWIEHIIFRDALRGDSALARGYERLKLVLAEQFGDDRDGYTRAKSPFIAEVLRKSTGTRNQ